MIKPKSLYQFYIAATSLVLSGFIVGEEMNWVYLLTTSWCCISGVFLIYRFNDFTDQSADLKFSFKNFFQEKINQLVVLQFVVLNVPLAFVVLPKLYFGLFVTVGVLGFMYSITWKVNSKKYRLKNIFFFKNATIGLLWGALIFLGAGNLKSDLIIPLFTFVSFQIFLGSVIRDVPDFKSDQIHHVHSIPVVLGIQGSFLIMHLINLASLFTAYLSNWNTQFILLIFLVVFWRTINLIGLQNSKSTKLWSDTVNLLTCSIIFLILLFQFFYGIY